MLCLFLLEPATSFVGRVMFKVVTIFVLSLFLAGCASRSSEISAAYVSPLNYQNYSCQQLTDEAQRISRRAQEVSGAQDSKATRDVVATTVGVVVFWPLLFAVGGDGPTAAELARLKGELEAVEKVSIEKKCDIRFERRQAGG